MEPWIALAIFVVTYGAIASDRVDRTLAALLGGAVVILLGIINQQTAFGAVDWNVIFLLFGMMVIAGVMRRTGIFGWLAIRTVRLGRGEPLAILLLMAGVTALLSAFLDNVTTVVLLVPVTLYIASTLRISPDPLRPRRGAGLEHRGDGDPDRRPAEHPHRLGERADLPRLPAEPDAGRGRDLRGLRRGDGRPLPGPDDRDARGARGGHGDRRLGVHLGPPPAPREPARAGPHDHRLPLRVGHPPGAGDDRPAGRGRPDPRVPPGSRRADPRGGLVHAPLLRRPLRARRGPRRDRA